jgi:O-antigen/teichoic acid export membrane protein
MQFFKRGIKNASFLIIGRVFGMIISYITLIFIVRKLTVEEFGLLSTVRTFVSSFIIFSFGGISGAVMREGAKNTSKMGILFEQTNGFKFLMSFFATALCLVALVFTPYENSTKLLIVIFSFSIIATSLLNHWKVALTATENFKTYVIVNLMQPFIYFLIAFIIIDHSDRVKNLISLQLFLQIFFMIVTLLVARRLINFKLNILSVEFNKSLITKGFYFFIISLAGMIFMKIDVLMISLLGDLREVGVYSIADRIAREGSELRTVILAGFFPVIIKRIKEGPINGSLVRNTVLKIFVLVFSSLIIISLNIEQIIIFMFGIKYVASAKILQLLIFFLAIDFTIHPYIMLLLSSNGEKYIAIIYSILAIANLVLNYIFYNIFGLIGIVYSTLTIFVILAIYTMTIGVKYLYREKILI